MNARLYVLHALAPLHVGTGQGIDLIDLPIARERASQHPLIPGSGVKGVLRDAARSLVDDGEDSQVWRAFGPNHRNAQDHASSLRFSDARLLLMPVSSDHGTFAWATCPWVLTRLLRDLTGLMPPPAGKIPQVAEGQARVVAESALCGPDEPAVLAGLKLQRGSLHTAWADWLADLVFPDDPTWRDLLRARLAVVHDDTYTWMVQHRTDVRAHIRIDEKTGTVDGGALWYEESLPTESVLVGIVQAVKRRMTPQESLKLLGRLVAEPLQFGGKATTGMGVARMRLHGGDA